MRLPSSPAPSSFAISCDPQRRLSLAATLGAALLLGACSTPAPAPTPAPATSKSAPRPPAPAPQPSAKRPAPPADARFAWPAQGPVIGRFDGNRNKGVDIGGEMGDAIVASADGRVAFVGSQLRGYGRLVIIKHDDTFITAYAHTSRILVKEREQVRKGQQIAEMGNSGADRVKLHFEIRRNGVAVNPQPYLDGRQR